MKQKNIFTIGYEGITVEQLIGQLQQHDMQCLIDVRDYPLSRKPGFSKTILSAILEHAGIEYLHLKGLGDPKDGRMAARAGDRDTFLKIFHRHLGSEAALSHLEIAAATSLQKTSCLLCYEKNHQNCHRTIVSEKISEVNSLKVIHLSMPSKQKPIKKMDLFNLYA